MSVIDEVKQRTDIVEVISQYASLKKAGRNFTALCPFHSEKHPSFFVYPEQQSWHCFGACNTGGDVFSFIMKKQNIDFGEALRLLAQRAGITIPSRSEPEAERGERERLYQVNQAAAQYFHNLLLNSPAGEKARNYLAGRGLSSKTIGEFQLGFSLTSREALKKYMAEKGYSEQELLTVGLIIEVESGETRDRFRNKLMFPIFDIRGRITGFGARVLDDSLPKYVNSPQTPVFDKSSTLYGINFAVPDIRQQDAAVIVEGYMDVITAHQNSLKNVVASMGTSVTEKQVSVLKKLSRNLVFALDADAAGEEAVVRSVGYENILDSEIKVVILPKEKDPDDVIREDVKIWQELLAKAVPMVDFTFNMVTAKLDLATARDKSLARDRLLPIIGEIKDIVRKAHYLQKLARLIRVSERTLEADLARITSSQASYQSREPKPEAVAHILSPLTSSPLEEYCLALLLQHPELKGTDEGLLPEYFENTENREIFLASQQVNDLSSLKDKLDITVHEHLDSLIKKNIPANQIEQKYADSVHRLEEKWLRNLELKKAEVLTVERESGGTAAELAKLKELGVSTQLGEVFTQRSRMKLGAKEVRSESTKQ